MGKYFGTDGIRRKANEFNEEFLKKIANSLAVELKQEKLELRVLIGGDTRISSKYIIDIIIKTLLKNGIEVMNAGIIPTPAISYLTDEYNCGASIMITASHNSSEYNGIKILNNQGLKANTKFIDKLEYGIDNFEIENNLSDLNLSPIDCHNEALLKYKKHLLSLCPINLEGITVLLDCANGATSVMAEEIFRELKANVKAINVATNFGAAINENCGSTHLETIKNVLLESVSFGVAFDGDGDRSLFVVKDSNGRIKTVDGDHVIAIIANYLKSKNNLKNNMIATTVMANQGLLNWAKQNNINVFTTDVGDTFVKEKMDEYGICVGGEQSGHIILEGQNTGDGILTALTLAIIIKMSNKTLIELSNIITITPQKIINIPATEDEKAKIEVNEVKQYIENLNSNLALTGSRVNLRPSGTEPLIRATIWAPTNEEIEVITKELLEYIENILNKQKNR